MTGNDSPPPSQHTACSASEPPRGDDHTGDGRTEQVIRCNGLLLQADKMLADAKQVARRTTPPATRQAFVDTYMQWYADSRAVILDPLRAQFETDYTTSVNRCPSIADLLADLTDVEVGTKPGRGFVVAWFKYLLNEQCDALRVTRRAIFPRAAQIPYDLRYSLATICKDVYHEYTIMRLFIDNGCLPTWWMPPLKPVNFQRMARALGWFDGIVLYAPEQELPIARAVCEAILRKPRLAPAIREQLGNLLQQLSPAPAPTLQSVPVDEMTAHLQELLTIHRQRLHKLEQQEARQGYNTSPEIRMEIDDLNQRIRDLEQLLTGAPS